VIRGGVIVALVLAFAGSASAHEWYSKRSDPVHKWSCCGGNDCNVFKIRPGNVMAEMDGLRIVLSLSQAMEINPHAMEGINALVPWNRIQASETNDWGICIATSTRIKPSYGIYCLFEPPSI
jgi:hypothetical protein